MKRAKKILDIYMQKAMAEKTHLGLGLAYCDQGDLLFWNYGWSDVAGTRAILETDFFEFGSLGKIFTAFLFGRLMDEGLCHETDPVQKFLPEVPSVLEINLRQLLTHTSGLPRDPFNFQNLAPANSFLAYGEQKFITALSKAALASDPGRFAYSNFGYLILGLAAKRITGHLKFSELLNELVLGPLGLVDLKFDLDENDLKRFCPGHTPEFNPICYLDLGETYNPAGGLKATMAGLGKFLGMLLNPESVPEPFRSALLRMYQLYSLGQNEEKVAFGLHTDIKMGKRVYHHAGHLAGTKSFLLLCPELGKGIVYASNTMSHVRAIWEVLLTPETES